MLKSASRVYNLEFLKLCILLKLGIPIVSQFSLHVLHGGRRRARVLGGFFLNFVDSDFLFNFLQHKVTSSFPSPGIELRMSATTIWPG